MADQVNDQADEGSETPVSDLLAEMIAASIEASDLDPHTFMLVRLAALIAVNAPPVSYLANLAVAGDVGVTREEVQGVASAIAPVVGTVRVVAAAGNIARAMGIVIMAIEDMDIGEMELGAEEV